MRNLIIVILSAVLLLVSCKPKEISAFYSPNKKIRLKIDFKNNRPNYSLTYENNLILTESQLGLNLDSVAFNEDLILNDISVSTVEQTYNLVAGKTSYVEETHTNIIIYLENRDNQKIEIEWNLYEDGATFRYIVPAQNLKGGYDVLSENTTFKLAGNPLIWMIDQGKNKAKSHWEEHYKATLFQEIADTSFFNLPILFIHNHYAGTITDGAVLDYPHLYLEPDSGILKAQFHLVDNGSKKVVAKKSSAFSTPWRVIMLANNELELIENNILTQLGQ